MKTMIYNDMEFLIDRTGSGWNISPPEAAP